MGKFLLSRLHVRINLFIIHHLSPIKITIETKKYAKERMKRTCLFLTKLGETILEYNTAKVLLNFLSGLLLISRAG